MTRRAFAPLLALALGCAPGPAPPPPIGPDYAGVAPAYGVDAAVLEAIVHGLADGDLAEDHDGDAEILQALRLVAEGMPRPVPLAAATAALVTYRRRGLTLDEAAEEARRDLRLSDAAGRIAGPR